MLWAFNMFRVTYNTIYACAQFAPFSLRLLYFLALFEEWIHNLHMLHEFAHIWKARPSGYCATKYLALCPHHFGAQPVVNLFLQWIFLQHLWIFLHLLRHFLHFSWQPRVQGYDAILFEFYCTRPQANLAVAEFACLSLQEENLCIFELLLHSDRVFAMPTPISSAPLQYPTKLLSPYFLFHAKRLLRPFLVLLDCDPIWLVLWIYYLDTLLYCIFRALLRISL